MTNNGIKISKALTWDEVAEYYKKFYGGNARTMEMNSVFEILTKDKRFHVHSKKGTIHKIN